MGSIALLLLKLALLAAYTPPPVAAAPAQAAECDKKFSYPFGTKKGCSKDPGFQIICHRDRSSGHQVPYLATETSDDIEVLNISWNTSEIQVSMPAYRACYDPQEGYNMWSRAFWVPPKVGISNEKNKFNVVGCSSYAFVYERKGKGLNGCNSRCAGKSSTLKKDNESCQNDLVQAVSNYPITIIVTRPTESSTLRHECYN